MVRRQGDALPQDTSLRIPRDDDCPIFAAPHGAVVGIEAKIALDLLRAMADHAVRIEDGMDVPSVKRIRESGGLHRAHRKTLQRRGKKFGEVLVPVGERAALVCCPRQQNEDARQQVGIKRPRSTGRAPKQGTTQSTNGECNGAPHMPRDPSSCIPASVSEQIAQDQRQQTTENAERKDEHRRLKQCGAVPSRQLEQRNQQKQADRQMYHGGMESSQELLPVCVCLPVQLEDKRQKQQSNTRKKRSRPN